MLMLMSKCEPALRHESHACSLKTLISRQLMLAGQFLTPDWKIWVVAFLLVTISKNMLTQTHVRNENHYHVKWTHDNTFLVISDFWSEKHWEQAHVYTSPKTGTGTSDVFGRLPTSAGIFGNDHVVFKNPSTPRIKLSHLYLRKSWQVYGLQILPTCKLKWSGHGVAGYSSVTPHFCRPF